MSVMVFESVLSYGECVWVVLNIDDEYEGT